MHMARIWHSRGFTLLEILFAVAIVGILIAIAYPMVRDYQSRARAADIVLKYDALKEGVAADLALGPMESCAELVSRLNSGNLQDEYAKLTIGFEKVAAGGYRAVLTVCADAAQQGLRGVSVAHAAHDVFAKTNRVEKGAVLSNTLVSFAVPLSGTDPLACRVATANPVTQCASAAPGVGTVAPQAPVQPVVVKPTPATGGAVPGSAAATPATQSGPGILPSRSTPPPSCSGGQVLSADKKSCACPSGQSWNVANGRCLTATAKNLQCQENCRRLHPHGNGRAYRDCVAGCSR